MFYLQLKFESTVPIANLIKISRFFATPTETDIHLFYDNQGAVKLAQNPVFHAKIKHIEAKHHFIRVRVLEGDKALDYIHTNNNLADLLTKSLPNFMFEYDR